MSAVQLSPSFDPNAIGLRPDDPRLRANTPNPLTAPGADRSDAASGTTPPDALRRTDTVTLSPAAQRAADADNAGPSDPAPTEPTENGEDPTAPVGRDGEPLDESEQKQVGELQARDREVRQHEQAHKAAAGPYATSGPTYTYQEGPDGKRYAVGGSVGIDTSPEATPEETIAKMQVVRRAALAPAEPSSQDRKVAAQASQTIQQARAELATQRQAEVTNQLGSDNKTGTDEPRDGGESTASTTVDDRFTTASAATIDTFA